MRTLRNEFLNVAGVGSVSLSSAPPSSGNTTNTRFTVEGNDQNFTTQLKQVDGNYLDLFGLELIAGQPLSDLDTATGFLVNEKLVRTAGFNKPEEILGKTIKM